MKYIFCTNCGKKILANNRFCPYCGHPIKHVATPNSDYRENYHKHVKHQLNLATFYNNYRNHKKLWAIVASIVVLVILMIGGIKIYKNYQYRQNSIKYVNLANTIPGHTWKESGFGTTMAYSKFYKDRKHARYFLDDAITFTNIKHYYATHHHLSHIPEEAVRLHSHSIVAGNFHNSLSNPLVIKLIHHHGNKYIFRIIEMPVPYTNNIHSRAHLVEAHVSSNRHELNLANGAHVTMNPQETTLTGGNTNGTNTMKTQYYLYGAMTRNITLTLSHRKTGWKTGWN